MTDNAVEVIQTNNIIEVVESNNDIEIIQTYITVEVVDGDDTFEVLPQSSAVIEFVQTYSNVEVLYQDSVIVEVVDAGPQGPRGDSGSGYVFTQISPLSIWNINHNLGYRPALNSVTSGGLTIEGSVLHLSNNQLTITFNTPTSGTARLV